MNLIKCDLCGDDLGDKYYRLHLSKVPVMRSSEPTTVADICLSCAEKIKKVLYAQNV